ncbi:DUF2577 family protein [Peptacetobacter hiranonis]|uniref:DUF2577 domain-containing protein n=1 Tax=Peptacetobacter hiranonis (strain DSM 13275 / JCM 10541 / KCTC 15199 / TO-931) TaxID=500633 RepID=B6G009_PEPHT|nr:DUF2577 family protein [Peptacetobacter hiranonis]EEA84837.1 hypothetical protein CLOHIR_01463 [Peptacetobacter hiranonis DSM 13275]QEK20757.1 hypothetical protein KGNDJEFE_01244 [Peptacetobacter hiranonis]
MKKNSRDPSIELLENMREEGKYFNIQECFLGEVISGVPNLKVRFEDIELTSKELYILQGVKDRKTASIESNYRFELKKGDKVVILQIANSYIVVDKVVKL